MLSHNESPCSCFCGRQEILYACVSGVGMGVVSQATPISAYPERKRSMRKWVWLARLGGEGGGRAVGLPPSPNFWLACPKSWGRAAFGL